MCLVSVWDTPLPETIYVNIYSPAHFHNLLTLSLLIEIMKNSQVTVPRYRENPLIIPFSMLCPGISQNTKLHHLTLYKGQVWGEKSYLKLCGNNVLNVVYSWSALIDEQDVLPVPGWVYETQIPWDLEILQSFAVLTNITQITFHSYDRYEDSLEDFTYQIVVGSYECKFGIGHYYQCVPPYRYYPWYIWTKEGFEIQQKLFRFKNNIFPIFPYFEPFSQYPPQGSRIANLFGLFDSSCWAMVFLTWLIIWYTFKLLEYIAERMGHTYEEVEIPFLPFR